MSFQFHYSPRSCPRLENALRSSYALLYLRYQKIRKLVLQKIGENYFNVFPEYQGKVEDHGEQAIYFLDASISENQLLNMTSLEIFLLLIGCHIHDIGMFIEDIPYTKQDRFLHYIVGEEFIKNALFLKLSEEERYVLSKISRWHSYDEWLREGKPLIKNIKIGKEIVRTMNIIYLVQMSDFFHKMVDVNMCN